MNGLINTNKGRRKPSLDLPDQCLTPRWIGLAVPPKQAPDTLQRTAIACLLRYEAALRGCVADWDGVIVLVSGRR